MKCAIFPFLCFFICASPVRSQDDASQLLRIFDSFGYEGAFILSTLDGDITLRVHPERLSIGAIPASTYKILNSCIALETEVIAGIHDTLRWDGQRKSFKSWEQDMDMSTAFQRSCVWFYQELARRVGAKQMQNWLERIDYGNKSISGGIDRFWLDGRLRISPEQQIQFLRKLFTDSLPFKHEVVQHVRSLMVLEHTDHHILYGKTGWGIIDQMHYGWLVGAVESHGAVWLYATLLVRKNADPAVFPSVRHDVTRALLRARGLIE